MLLQIGNLKIENQGNPPNIFNVKNFLEYSIEKVEAIGLNSFIWGRVLTDWKITKDFDYVLNGNISDYDKLEKVFFDLCDYAYNKVNLKLDLKWLSSLDIVKIDNENEINFNDVDFIIERCRKKKIEEKILTLNYNINTIPVSKWLVKSNYKFSTKNSTIPWTNKPHHIEHVKKHNGFLNVPAKDFLMSIDDYFKE
jgi:hypothetical protein